VNALEAGLKKSGAPYELYRYDAHHAFCNERRPEVYDAAAAKKAWERMLKFLSARL
jgi:carboxymethylenebutenolidase